MDDLPRKVAAKPATEAPEQSAIRGAYLSHLTEKPGGAVVGDEAGDTVLRGIYAARIAVVAPRSRQAKSAAKQRVALSRKRPAKRAKPVARAKQAKKAKKAGRKSRRH